jgi:hypothetical protein
MMRKSIAIICLFSGLSATPVLSQVLRVDTVAASSSILRDRYGNMITSQSIQIKGTLESRMESLIRYKVSYVTDYIKLNQKEAEYFWPMYYEYLQKLDELRVRSEKLLQQINSQQTIATISDNEVKALLDSYLMTLTKESQVYMDYYRKFLTILPAKKVAKIYQAEALFQKYLMIRLKNGDS